MNLFCSNFLAGDCNKYKVTDTFFKKDSLKDEILGNSGFVDGLSNLLKKKKY